MSIINKILGRSDKQDLSKPEPIPAPTPPPEPELIQVTEILPDDLQGRINNGDDLVVVDMRQGWEYQSGHIPGATHMFLQEIPARYTELPQDRDIVFQCWHGNTSLQASAFLIQNGWDAGQIFSLNGGMAGWVSTNGQDSLVKD